MIEFICDKCNKSFIGKTEYEAEKAFDHPSHTCADELKNLTMDELIDRINNQHH